MEYKAAVCVCHGQLRYAKKSCQRGCHLDRHHHRQGDAMLVLLHLLEHAVLLSLS